MSFRDGPFNDLKVPLTWTAALAVVVAIVIGVAVLVSDRRETLQTEAYGVSRRMFDVADAPVAGVLSAPVNWVRSAVDFTRGYFFAVSENRRLKKQLEEMRQWRQTAIALEDVNARYRAILGLKTDPPIPMVSGRVVLDSRGPFANTRLANIGSEAGVKIGNPVMNDRGLVGRVVGVTRGASRIMLVTDVASRTPVLVDRTDARAILMGDGGANPRLGFLRGQNPVKEGDRILTSGDGGMFPRGLPVGVAAKGLDGQWRVRLNADLSAIDFVRVLQFEDFTTLVDMKELERTSMPPVGQSVLPAARPVAAAGAPAAVSAAQAAAPRPAPRPTAPAPSPAPSSAPARPAPSAATPAPKVSPPRPAAQAQPEPQAPSRPAGAQPDPSELFRRDPAAGEVRP